MQNIKSFKDLIVWQKSILLNKDIFRLVKTLSKEDIYTIGSQMQRSAVSISSNIAEGFNRGSKKEYVYFLRIAYGSCAELETQLIILSDIYKLKQIENCIALNVEIQKMLNTIIKNFK